MILTGNEIRRKIKEGKIVIEPFNEKNIEPNSYGFHLARDFIKYDLEDGILDYKEPPIHKRFTITEEGFTLLPGKLYLSNTIETMGSECYAKTLYARCSTAIMGMWIQYSAPLGHTGSIIPWTLEIKVAKPTIVYPGMLIGKIAFWEVEGSVITYDGKYDQSKTVMPSAGFEDCI